MPSLPLRGRVNHQQYAGWSPTRFAESGLGCRLDANVDIPLSDGVNLSADVYRPQAEGRFPAIVQIGAYNKELHTTGVPKGTAEIGSPPVIVDRGYVQVVSSRRGMGRSGGVSGEFFCKQEVDDYVEAIAWAAAQPWCNGKVCLFGTSYYGLVQPLVAVRRPPALAAFFANEICTDFFRHIVAYAGSVNNRFLALWLGANFKDEDFERRVEPWKRALMSQVLNRPWMWERLAHPKIESIYESFLTMRPRKELRAWFAKMVTEAKSRETAAFGEGPFRELARVNVPFVAVQNQAMWNIHQFGAFDLFERAGTPENQKYLIVGPAEYELPVLSWQLEALAFFDHAVKGVDNGYSSQPRVRFWLQGSEEFGSADTFPVRSARRTRLHLTGGSAAGGALGPDTPQPRAASWAAIPLSTPLPDGLDEVVDQHLSYSLIAQEQFAVVGPVTVNLRFECNELDSFVIAALSRVDNQGKRHVLSLGAIRPARRTVDESLSNATEVVIDSAILTPLVPGESVVLRFSLVPLAVRLTQGEKLLLQIASRSDLVRGKIGDGFVHFDLEAPPYFSKNVVREGADSYIEVDLLDSTE